MHKQHTAAMAGAHRVLRGLAGSLIILALPAGAGVALLAFASTQAWRLDALAMSKSYCRQQERSVTAP